MIRLVIYIMDVFNIFCKYFRLPEGMANVSKYPILCTALLDDGSWSEEDLGELAINNLIGIFSEVVHVQDILVDINPNGFLQMILPQKHTLN